MNEDMNFGRFVRNYSLSRQEIGGPVNNLVSGASVAVERDGQRIRVPIELQPYGVAAFVSDGASVRIAAWDTDPVAAKELAHMHGLIAAGKDRLADSELQNRLPKEDRQHLEGIMARAGKALNRGKYARAWAELTDGRYQQLLNKNL